MVLAWLKFCLTWLKAYILDYWYGSKKECDLKDRHTEYIRYEEFQKKCYYNQLKTLLPEIQESLIYDRIHKLLEEMSQLTGLLLIIGDEGARKSVKYYGTGFIARIRRIRSKRDGQFVESDDPGSVSAIVTVTTAYHTFNEDNREVVDNFAMAKEIWDKYKTEFKLGYNVKKVENDDNSDQVSPDDSQDDNQDGSQDDDSLDDNQDVSQDDDSQDDNQDGSQDDDSQNDNQDVSQENHSQDDTDLKKVRNLDTLYGHRLLETDKDINYKSDWCAIECTTSDIGLIEKLETSLSNFQSSLAELYQLSQTSESYKNINLVVIIGHPHFWPKTFSFGRSHEEKEILKEIRSYQTWCRYTYDNPVCNGISGAPIFKWGQPISGFGYWFGHPHNHSELVSGTNGDGEKVTYGKSTIGVENIY